MAPTVAVPSPKRPPFRNMLMSRLGANTENTQNTPPSDSFRSPTPTPRKMRPGCTHISAIRCLGDYTCQLCGDSSTKIMYMCDEDRLQLARARSIPHPILPDLKPAEPPLIEDMKLVGVKNWMLDLARRRHYSDRQLEILVRQRQQVIDVSMADDSHRTNGLPRCSLQVCHHCRPTWDAERARFAIDAVFANEVEPLYPRELATLRVLDAKHLRNIGLRPPPTHTPSPKTPMAPSSRVSMASSSTTRSDPSTSDDDDAAFIVDAVQVVDDPPPLQPDHSMAGDLATPVAHPADAFTKPFRRAFASLVRRHRRRNGSVDGRRSSVSLPMPCTASLGEHADVDAAEFDLGVLREQADVQRAARRGGSERALTLSLSLDLQRELDDAVTPPGDEVEVVGGLALTEEAVETHMPDIITQA